MKLLLSPHNDDETLFAGYLCAAHKPDAVLIVFDSYVQPMRGFAGSTYGIRRRESVSAVQILSPATQVLFAGVSDAEAEHSTTARAMLGVDNTIGHNFGTPVKFDILIAPAYEEGGHFQHNVVASLAARLKAKKRISYSTYVRGRGRTTVGEFGRSVNFVRFVPSPQQIIAKLHALACYESQIEIPNVREWFTGGLDEYIAER